MNTDGSNVNRTQHSSLYKPRWHAQKIFRKVTAPPAEEESCGDLGSTETIYGSRWWLSSQASRTSAFCGEVGRVLITFGTCFVEGVGPVLRVPHRKLMKRPSVRNVGDQEHGEPGNWS